MPFEGGRITTFGNGGSGVRVDGTSSFRVGRLDASHNAGHGLDMDEGATVSVGTGDFSHNGGDGIHQRAANVVSLARAAGAGASLNDDELYRALQAVHLAKDTDRPRLLLEGPLWPSFVKAGLDVVGALASIASFYQGMPR